MRGSMMGGGSQQAIYDGYAIVADVGLHRFSVCLLPRFRIKGRGMKCFLPARLRPVNNAGDGPGACRHDGIDAATRDSRWTTSRIRLGSHTMTWRSCGISVGMERSGYPSGGAGGGRIAHDAWLPTSGPSSPMPAPSCARSNPPPPPIR